MAISHRRLVAVAATNVVAAFVLAHLWVDRVEHVHLNLRQLWPALAVGASSGLVLLVLREPTGRRRRADVVLGVVLVAALLGALALGRARPVATNAEFLRSMIPLQSEAIQLCRSAQPSEPDVARFCADLVQRREAEIWELTRLLRRY